MIGNLIYSKGYYLVILFIVIPLNIRFIYIGDIWLGIILILLQIPYLTMNFKRIWLPHNLNTDIKRYNVNSMHRNHSWSRRPNDDFNDDETDGPRSGGSMI